MPAHPTSAPAQFIQGAPVLHVRDVSGMAAYFRDTLGFTWDFGDENYAVVWRENSAIHLVKRDGEPSNVHLFQWVRDVDACYAEVLARGADITRPPHTEPYGLREFAVRAPNGLAIVFGQEID